MIEHIVCGQKFGFDNNKYLIAFWKSIQAGWNPFENIKMTKELYDIVKEHKEEYHPEIVALVGFCSTYNAKWFGGYAGTIKTKDGKFRNYYDEAVRNVLKQASHVQDVIFECADYREIKTEGSLIYCDPPYIGKTGYCDYFDHSQFWDWCRKMSEKNIVLCSEYIAPKDFMCIWQKELTTTLDKNSRSQSVEKLFCLNERGKNDEIRRFC